MTVGVPAAVLASIVSLTVAIAMLLRRPRRPLYSRLAGFSLALFLWHGTSAATRFVGDLWLSLQLSAALFLAPTAIAFFTEVVRDHSAFNRRIGRLAVGGTLALLALTLSPAGTYFITRAVAAAYVVAAFGWVFHTLYLRARIAKAETERRRLWYLVWGGLIAMLLAFGELIPNTEWPAVAGHVASTLYVYFLYQSVISRRVIDLVEFVGKAAVLFSLTLVLASIYALLVLWLGGRQQELWLFNTLVASFVILILYDQVRPWIEEAVTRLLFRQRYALQQGVRRLLRELRTTISPEDMVTRVLDALPSSGRAHQVALYLAGEGELEFELRGSRGSKPPQALTLRQHPALLQELRRERRPILLETLVERAQELPPALIDGDPSVQRDTERAGEAIASMRAIDAQLVLPMLAEDHVVGILALGTEHPADAYATEEIATLMSVADACAIVIENSLEYEHLRARDRLAALGEMAAGMAHEIRNPLGAIKGAAQCLEPEHLPREAGEFVGVIIEETDRLGRVLGQFLEYARPHRGNPVPIRINDVITATLKLLAADSLPATVRITPHLGADLGLVSVDPEHLKQVVLNLVLNAAQAMPNGGEITITTSSSHDASGEYVSGSRLLMSDHVVIRVHDNGPGIAAEDLSRVFVPFFTTKPHGTGLGLAISDRIVRNAGGRIEVTSHPGHGTTFTVRLPLVGPAHAHSS